MPTVQDVPLRRTSDCMFRFAGNGPKEGFLQECFPVFPRIRLLKILQTCGEKKHKPGRTFGVRDGCRDAILAQNFV